MSKKFICAKSLPGIKVPSESIKIIFNKDKKVKDNYQHTLCELLSKSYGCAFNVISKNENKTSVSFYLNCISDKTVTFKLSCDIRAISFDKDLSLRIESNSKKLCESHEDNPENRNLSHEKRIETQEKLLENSAIKVISIKLKKNTF